MIEIVLGVLLAIVWAGSIILALLLGNATGQADAATTIASLEAERDELVESCQYLLAQGAALDALDSEIRPGATPPASSSRGFGASARTQHPRGRQ